VDCSVAGLLFFSNSLAGGAAYATLCSGPGRSPSAASPACGSTPSPLSEATMFRTVSLLPAAMEIVGALELIDQLVAVSHECDYPDEANHRPPVSRCEIHGRGWSSDAIDRWVSERLRSGKSLYTLDEPLLRDLAPDLILTQRLCDVCAPAYGSVATLAAALPSNPRVLNLEPKTLGSVFCCVANMAAAMGHPDRAAEVCRHLEQRVAEVAGRVAGRRRPTVFVMEWADPIVKAGH
jgi:iron complex transport system substrate-binding protein